MGLCLRLLHLLLNLLLLAGLLTVLMGTWVLSLVPSTAANARSRHEPDRHLNIPAVLLMDRLHFLQSLDLKFKCIDFLHQHTLVGFLEQTWELEGSILYLHFAP